MSKLKIIAVITAKEAYREEVLKSLYAVTDSTRTETDNISYVLHEDTKNHLRFILIEEWQSAEAIAIHNKTPHYIALHNELDGKTEGIRADIIREIY